MKYFKLFVFTFLALLVVSINVSAQSVEMTASELIDTAQNGVITLTQDVELTTNLSFSSSDDVKKLDLGGYTLTLVATISGNDGVKTTNPIAVFDTTVEITNGTIKRDASLTRGGLILVGDKNKGADAHIILTDVVLDGNNVVTSNFDATLGNGDWIYYNNNNKYQIRGIGAALYVGYGADVTLTNTTIKNHNGKIAVSLICAGNVILKNSKIINNNSKPFNGSALKISFENTLVSENIGGVQIENSGEFIFDSDSIIKNNVGVSSSGLSIQNNNSNFVMKATISGTIQGNETRNPENDFANGGGVYIITTNSNSIITFTKTAKIIDNIAGGAGGGIYINSYKDSSTALMTPGKVIIDGAIITGNIAKSTPVETTLKDGGGAGIYVARGIAEIKDVIIEDNVSTSGKGSAILVSHAGGAINGGKLTIEKGTISGDILLGQYMVGDSKKDAGSIIINGGIFTHDMKDYVSTGVVSKKVNDNYVVGKENSIVINEVSNGKVETSVVKAIVGETVTLTVTPDEGYEVKSVKVVGTGNTEIPVIDNKFIMPNAKVTITVEFNKITTTVDAPVIKLEEKQEKVEIGVLEVDNIEKTLLESLTKHETLKELAKDESIKVSVEVTKMEISKDEESKITEEIKKKYENIVVSEYFDITVAVKNTNNEKVGELASLTDKIQLVVALSEELKKVEDGKVRNYYVIRQHGDEIEYISDVKLSEDGKSLIFSTDKFSTYAIAYEDLNVEEDNITNSPQTGDNIIVDMLIGISAIVLIAGTVKYIKKKNLFNA